MIRCTPRGVCSWDFQLEGDGHRGALDFNWMSEQGTVTADRERLLVEKHGVMSGHWTLEGSVKKLASAKKPNAFTRTFEITSPMGLLVLSAESAVRRAFQLEDSDGLLATIAPEHAFTRRSRIEVTQPDYDFPTVSFAFWLAVLTWRRQRNNSS